MRVQNKVTSRDQRTNCSWKDAAQMASELILALLKIKPTDLHINHSIIRTQLMMNIIMLRPQKRRQNKKTYLYGTSGLTSAYLLNGRGKTRITYSVGTSRLPASGRTLPGRQLNWHCLKHNLNDQVCINDNMSKRPI